MASTPSSSICRWSCGFASSKEGGGGGAALLHLDDVPAEGAPHRRRAHLPGLEGEGGLRELGHHVAALEEAEVAALLGAGAGGAAAGHLREVGAAARSRPSPRAPPLRWGKDVAGAHLRLALAAGGFLLVAGADRLVRHLAADLAGKQRLLQLLLLGAADAAAHLVVPVEAGGAGGGHQRALGDGAVHELARHLAAAASASAAPGGTLRSSGGSTSAATATTSDIRTSCPSTRASSGSAGGPPTAGGRCRAGSGPARAGRRRSRAKRSKAARRAGRRGMRVGRLRGEPEDVGWARHPQVAARAVRPSAPSSAALNSGPGLAYCRRLQRARRVAGPGLGARMRTPSLVQSGPRPAGSLAARGSPVRSIHAACSPASPAPSSAPPTTAR